MDNSIYYKHSGKVPAKALLLSLIFIPFTAWFCAWSYVNLVWYIPFVFINFILTLLFSLLGCIPLFYGVKHGNIRNKGVVILLALLAGMIGVYTQWALYCSYIMHSVKYVSLHPDSIPFHASFNYFLFHPGEMIGLAKVIYEAGTWSISGSQVNGIPLLLVWVLEAGMTISIGAFFIVDLMKFPFSESANKWLEEERAPHGLKPLGIPVQDIRSRLESGDAGMFSTGILANNFDRVRYELGVYKTSDLTEIYITLFEVKITVDKGKTKKSSTPLIKQLRINKSNYEKLLETPFYKQTVVTTPTSTVVNPVKTVVDPPKYGPPPDRPL